MIINNEYLSINGYFAQSLRYARKLILGISTICLWLIFSHALILSKISPFWTDTPKKSFMNTERAKIDFI
jgi:hypothetical protein